MLVGLNELVATLVYGIALSTLNIGNSWFTALCVGVLYPVLLRSRFTFFRPVGEKDDPKLDLLSLRVDKFYTSLQERCYREVDNVVAVSRTMQARMLADRYLEGALLQALTQVIAARQVASDRERDGQYLEELRRLPKERRRYMLAMFLVDIAGKKAEHLLSTLSTQPAPNTRDQSSS